jgi:ADP-L-glycero-D-manno-heptose 6-epimerase
LNPCSFDKLDPPWPFSLEVADAYVGVAGAAAAVQLGGLKAGGVHPVDVLRLRLPPGWGKGGQARAGRGTASMLLVTGGAGFIGSNVVASLDEAGGDVAVNDLLGSDGKWRNLGKRRLADVVPPGELFRWLDGRRLDAVIHMGAISDTTARDGDVVMENNFRLSLRLLDWCAETRTPLIYASSAATYGDGAQGFDDDNAPAALARLKPMNLYGWSKHLFDLAVVDRARKGGKLPPQWAGLKFFNVFGPNEYHKGEMMSLVAKRFADAKGGKPVVLFKSHRAGIGDGEQRRDFIYVDDAVAVVRWLLETPKVSGIYNVGTGRAESFRDLITAMFAALGRAPNIAYVDMPETIRDSYQYFTRASVENLRRAGYNAGFTPLADAVRRYVASYLDTPDRYR